MFKRLRFEVAITRVSPAEAESQNRSMSSVSFITIILTYDKVALKLSEICNYPPYNTHTACVIIRYAISKLPRTTISPLNNIRRITSSKNMDNRNNNNNSTFHDFKTQK